MEGTDYEYMNEASIDEDLVCSICGTVMNNPCRTPCGHHFCRECIAKWLEQHQTCPLCSKEHLKVNHLGKAETRICDQLNQLRVKCKHCGRTNISRGRINDHIQNDCSTITLFTSRRHRQDDLLDNDFATPIMEPAGSLINQIMAENFQLKEQLEHQKTIISRHTDQIDILKERLQLEKDKIEQTNIFMKTIKQALEKQQEQIEEQENSINELRKVNQHLLNHIKSRKKDSTEHEIQIHNLWEQIGRKLKRQIHLK